jgi:predicted enzyme related to lactoylglutathione lyase
VKKATSSGRKATPRRRAAAPVPIRGIDFVMYNTKDIRKTRAFYQRLFGLKKGEEWNDWWSEFHTEPITLSLNGTPDANTREWDWSGPACVAFAVDDVRRAIAACRRRKVKVLIEPVETRVCWMAWIADPDGNRICLHSRKDGSSC